MRLYIIRHGQSTNNALADPRDRVQDPDLTPLGHEQARLLAEYLRSDRRDPKAWGDPPITRLFCSPMRRALQTAQPLGEALGLRPEVWVEIHESGGIYLDHGEHGGVMGYPGMTRQEMLQEFPNYVLPEAVTERGWWDGEKEDWPACQARAIRVAQQLLQWTDLDEHVALVSHGGFIDALIKALLNQLPGQHVFYHHANTGVTRIDLQPEGYLDLRFLNRVDHLPISHIT